tara:strand:+ start:11479 stop:13131 length:1653 start_codon:yes stop_codon:yes gene_type:complete
MIANNLIEIYTLIFSWNLYNAIWEVLVGTGLALIPFIIILIQALSNYNAMKGVKGTVHEVEMTLLGMIVVMSLCVIPYPNNVSLASIKYSLEVPDCQVRNDIAANTDGDGDNTGEYHDVTFAGMAGNIVQQPVSWYAVNYLSTAITHASIKAMSCVNNYELMLLRLSQVRIQDPIVRNRVKDFHEACYLKTRARFDENPVAIPNDIEPIDDIDWIGSRLFQNYADEYYEHQEAYMTNMEEFGFTRDEVNRSSDAGAQPLAGANPSCKEIWVGEANGVNPAKGLRDVILEAIPIDEVGSITDDWQAWGHFVVTDGNIHPRDSGDLLIKMILEADALNLDSSTDIDLANDFEAEQAWGKELLDMVSGLFGAASGTQQFFEINTLKQMAKVAGPMLIALIQMVIVMAAPFLMVHSGYKFATFFGLAWTYFAFEFVNVIWATAYWFDNHILDLYWSNSDGLLDSYTNTLLGLIISAGNIIILPLLWLGLMSSAGSNMIRSLSAGGGGAGGGAAGVAGSGGGDAARGSAGLVGKKFSQRSAARKNAASSGKGGGE